MRLRLALPRADIPPSRTLLVLGHLFCHSIQACATLWAEAYQRIDDWGMQLDSPPPPPCSGQVCTALWAEAYERIDHWGRSIDPKWLRMTRQVNG